MLGNMLIGFFIFALLFVLPTWPYSANWGYYPTGILGSALVLLLISSLVGFI
jgi:hypothetical protein